MWPGLIRIMWLPRWRAQDHPSLRKAAWACCPLMVERLDMTGLCDGNLDKASFHGDHEFHGGTLSA